MPLHQEGTKNTKEALSIAGWNPGKTHASCQRGGLGRQAAKPGSGRWEFVPTGLDSQCPLPCCLSLPFENGFAKLKQFRSLATRYDDGPEPCRTSGTGLHSRMAGAL